ncbi:hypothetical protein Efla_002315 [Eimeria flavescens]
MGLAPELGAADFFFGFLTSSFSTLLGASACRASPKALSLLYFNLEKLNPTGEEEGEEEGEWVRLLQQTAAAAAKSNSSSRSSSSSRRGLACRMDGRASAAAVGGGSGTSGFSFFSHFSPLSNQQKQAAHEVLPGLFLGSAVAARSATWLHQQGITHILCLHNAAAAPHVLQQQLQQQLQKRREVLRYSPELEPARVQQQQQLLQRLQQQQLAHHLAVHPDRYVYCCCHAVDTPTELVLPLLPFCLDFIDRALIDRNYRMHPPDEQQLAAAAAAAAEGAPQQNVRLLQSRRRNHCFLDKTAVVDAYPIPEDALLQAGAAAAAARDTPPVAAAAAAAGGDSRRVGGRVLVHCAKGISRSACVMLAYLMYRKSLRCEDALAFLCLKRPVYPNVGFQVQLQYLQERMEEVRPALPHAIGPQEEQQQQQQQQPKAAARAAAAAAAHAFDAAVSIEKSEPDIFRRDPDARTQEQVSLLFAKAALLQQRNLWRPFGLFFENLRSYQLQQDEEVLARAEQTAQKAAELKLVFAATLPGVSMADKVADEIKTWVSDCRAAAAAAAAKAADAAPAAAAPQKEISSDLTQPEDAVPPPSNGLEENRNGEKFRIRGRERVKEEKKSRRRSSSSSSRHSSSNSSRRSSSRHSDSSSSSRASSTERRRYSSPIRNNNSASHSGGPSAAAGSIRKRHRSSSRDEEKANDRGRKRGKQRNSSSEADKKKKKKSDTKKKRKKKEKKKQQTTLKLKLKVPKPKPQTQYSSDSE